MELLLPFLDKRWLAMRILAARRLPFPEEVDRGRPDGRKEIIRGDCVPGDVGELCETGVASRSMLLSKEAEGVMEVLDGLRSGLGSTLRAVDALLFDDADSD